MDMQEALKRPVKPVFQVEIETTRELFLCEQGETILQAMERLGRTGIPVGCRGGGCGVCKIRVCKGTYESGPMSGVHVTPTEAAAGMALACRVRPRSDLKIQIIGGMGKSVCGYGNREVRDFWREVRQKAAVGGAPRPYKKPSGK